MIVLVIEILPKKMNAYHEIIERLPEVLVRHVHTYADPETTCQYTKVYEIRKYLTEFNVGYSEKRYELFFKYGALNDDMQNNKLFQRLNGLMRYLPQLLGKKSKGKFHFCEFEKHYMQYFIAKKGDWNARGSRWIIRQDPLPALCTRSVDRIELVTVMILCGYDHKIISFPPAGYNRITFRAQRNTVAFKHLHKLDPEYGSAEYFGMTETEGVRKEIKKDIANWKEQGRIEAREAKEEAKRENERRKRMK